MMKHKIKILTENFTSDGQKIDLSKISIKDISFGLTIDYSDDCVGNVIPYLEGNEMFIDTEIKEEHLDLFPSVMIKVDLKDIEDKEGVKYIKKCELIGISFCSGENVDRTIQSLREQINNK